MQLVRETGSVEATIGVGETIGRVMPGGLTIGLVGPLGAGKTRLIKGIAAGNDWPRPDLVTSPTFTLVHEYPGRLMLYHVDMYRLRGPDDLHALGLAEWIRPDSVVVVEWADRASGAIPPESLWIDMRVTGETRRKITFEAADALSQRCLQAVEAALDSSATSL